MRASITWRNAVILFLAVIVVVSGYLLLKEYLRGRRYENGYVRVQVGDSQEMVVAAMGKPDEIDICRTVSSPSDTAEDKKYQEQCAVQYRYNTFLKPYLISFDKDMRVLAKGHQVSP
ncbi:MAG: hypothetical protein AABN95_09550 [Acidobacteriota bacterium]